MDSQKQTMQSLWRKAIGQNEPLKIRCASLADARRLRFALYNAVREFREGRDGRPPRRAADPELRRAVEECTVLFDQDDARVVVMQTKASSSMMQAALAALGADAPAGLDEVQMAAEVSAEEVRRKLGALAEGPAPAMHSEPTPAATPLHRTTSYYTR